MTDEIDKTLAERGKTHGDFGQNAAVSQGIKQLVKRGWEGNPGFTLSTFGLKVAPSPVQLEALDFIAGKLGRINQNPHEIDHWRDIAGYAMLVVRDLTRAQESPNISVQVPPPYPEAPLRRG